MDLIQAIHEKAVRLASTFKNVEHQLMEVLEEVDTHRVFAKMGYSSLFTYAVDGLKLSESCAYALINVTRKARHVPELKEAIASGNLTVSKAKKITSVITPENSAHWINTAQQMTSRELEKAVVSINPKATIEKMKYVASDRVQFQCGISEELMNKMKRAQDLLSQKLKRPASMEEVLEALASGYLQREDPVLKAARTRSNKQQVPGLVRRPIPIAVKHEVAKRDHGQCSFVDKEGKRCTSTRFVSMHHVKPVSMGGKHSAENLATLCFNHHRLFHDRDRQVPVTVVP